MDETLPAGTYHVCVIDGEIKAVPIERYYSGPIVVGTRSWRVGRGRGSVFLEQWFENRWSQGPMTTLKASRLDLLRLAFIMGGGLYKDPSGLTGRDLLAELLERAFFHHPDARRYKTRLQ